MNRILCLLVLLSASIVRAGDAPIRVMIVKPEMRKIKRIVEQPGTVRADEEAPLAAKIAGYVQTVSVDIGDTVKAGDPLIAISVPELDEEAKLKDSVVKLAEVSIQQLKKHLQTAEAQVAAADALVKEAEAGMKRAEANYDRWASESKRMTEMALKKLVDDQSRDESINQMKSADAARDEVRAKVFSAQAILKKYRAERDAAELDIRGGEAKLEVARADAARFKEMLAYKTIKAPFGGVVTKRLVDPGHFVQQGKPETLLVIANMNPVRVLIDVPESEAALVKKGDIAQIRFPAWEGKTVTGPIARSSWSLDSQSRTLRAEIDLPNPDGALRPGMYANVFVSVETSDVRTVPAKALAKAGETMALFAVRDGKAVRVRVKAGRSDGTFTEVALSANPRRRVGKVCRRWRSDCQSASESGGGATR